MKIVLRLEHRVKVNLRRMRRDARDKGLADRCQIVLLTAKGRVRADVAESVGRSVSWVNRVVARFRDLGVAGLLDRREDNGYPRPTWTRELLAKVLHQLTGVKVHPATLSRPRPTVGCPWPKRRRNKRLMEIDAVVNALPKGHVAVYLDEVDVHLNPKIGLDWMNRGTQKEVPTPGKNVKRYLCGALDAETGLLTWVRGERKNSLLFIATLRKLAGETYADKKVIHVVLDNCSIHDSKITQAAVAELGGRVKLHFLPPYCPQANRIERVWLDVHANVTRNHRCVDMDELMGNVSRYLMARNARTRAKLRAAA